MRVYDGANWIAASSAGTASLILYEYTATSGQTTFSGSDDNSATLSYSVGNIQVVMNGVILDPSDFTATSGTSVVLASGAATGDLLNIYAFKSFTVSDTVSASSGGTFAADVAFTANANFGDNDKAQFGAGSDLQIYHDGSNSYISDQGTGHLQLLAAEFRLNNSANSENMITAAPDGAVTLFHNDSAKIATTSTGATVTGVLSVGGTNATAKFNVVGQGGSNVQLQNNIATGTGGVVQIGFINDNGLVGSIQTSGSATSYVTSSDIRLKQNVTYNWDATTRLKKLKPARFNFIADADTTVDGFLAHEAQAVVPEAVTGTHNEVDDDGNPVMQGIDQSKLVPLLVKTIQELEARITALEAE